ncbi:sigma-54-dependent Fis family transcriptional regulator [Serratia rhizosphaerae]|uniref:sigma-54-dependent Fis family transcriptional regulator n=1 Tax=Serratia rhizosphaerae TaxID=2597702 RepID=UPI002DB90487|nr:sigma 54-interacting transcriptional regulator [Serratia rhizosphaerae]MEB6336121.1 sigma 54-interacting transcriptional regulator [Serratia rhizosphaerae]
MDYTPERYWDEEWELIARLNNEQAFSRYIKALHQAWRVFWRGETPSGVRAAVHASWARSRSNGIDPDHFQYRFCEEKRLQTILAHNAPLIAIARGVMRNLLAYNPNGHINLTDASGITLYFCGQDLTPVGSMLSEDVSGTNCTGRCLSENRLVYLLNGENYKRALRQRDKHCAAAPVRDENGVTIGVLTLTANSGNFHYHTLGTVQAAAEAISQQLMLRQLLEEQQSVLESINEGVIVLGQRGNIRQLNSYARQVLGISPRADNQDIDNVLQPEACSLKTLNACKDRSITFCPDGGSRITCLISVVCTPDGGKVISLRENRRIRDITHKVIGSSASYHFDMILGQSAAMQAVRNRARTASRSDSTVLLGGESGTGKELFAQSIHNSSARRNGPFLAVNCGAIPRDLVQSELFGYEDGAFTGSRRGGAAGKFELADGGTLFLDEIGDMPLDAQASLLRVLQENEVTRIGGNRPLKVNVRIIAASHRDLEKEVAGGAFRRDLWFRLNVIDLQIPPLRQRKEDISELADGFCEQICRTLGREKARFTAAALRRLEAYGWPGNVRELENIVERTLNLTDSRVIDEQDLPDVLQTAGAARGHAISGSHSLQESERNLIILCLTEKAGNLRQVALALNLSRGALYNKLKRYGIDADDYRRDKAVR